MIDKLDLHPLEKWWLNSRGGRSEIDVEVDSEGMYVEMLGIGGYVKKVYIPHIEIIKREMNYHG
jgi:hypothetical protein